MILIVVIFIIAQNNPIYYLVRIFGVLCGVGYL
jgi:hypothetical protein